MPKHTESERKKNKVDTSAFHAAGKGRAGIRRLQITAVNTAEGKEKSKLARLFLKRNQGGK